MHRSKGTIKSSKSTSNLFTGLLFCGFTGDVVTLCNKGEGARYLVADGARRGTRGNYFSWRYDEFEASFLQFVKELDTSELQERAAPDVATQIGGLESERTERKRAVQRLTDAIAETDTEVKPLLLRLQQEQDRLITIDREIELLEAEKVNTIKTDLHTLADDLRTPAQRLSFRNCLQKQIRKIWFYPAGFIWSKEISELIVSNLPSDYVEKDHFLGIPDVLLEYFKNNAATNAIQFEVPPKTQRFFYVCFKNGLERMVMPTPSDPRKLINSFLLNRFQKRVTLDATDTYPAEDVVFGKRQV